MQSVKIVVWQDGDAWIGYLQEYPDYWTQGSSIEDLREHLKDLHAELSNGIIPGARRVEDLMKRVDLIRAIETQGASHRLGVLFESDPESRLS